MSAHSRTCGLQLMWAFYIYENRMVHAAILHLLNSGISLRPRGYVDYKHYFFVLYAFL